jgi:hypothetical protein
MVESKIRLSNELWNSVFNADNKDVDGIFNTFLNTCRYSIPAFLKRNFVRDLTQNLG